MNEEQWIFKKHNSDTVEVVSTPEFQKNLKDQHKLQHDIEVQSLPTDPNVDLVKKIHQQLPITNWAWELKKEREHEEELKKEKQQIAQQSFNYPTYPKQPDNGPSL